MYHMYSSPNNTNISSLNFSGYTVYLAVFILVDNILHALAIKSEVLDS